MERNGLRVTDEELEAARRRDRQAEVSEARAVAARYDRGTGCLFINLRGGALLVVPAHLLQGVTGAAPELIEQVEMASGGRGLHWEALDADLLVQSLAAGSFGTRRWMEQLVAAGRLDDASRIRLVAVDELTGAASALGRKGGSARSAAKAAAVRENGKKGGRPRKQTADLR